MYKYLTELWRKKQSDVMRFLLRVRTWHFRQQSQIIRVPRPTRPDRARRLGYKAKQGASIRSDSYFSNSHSLMLSFPCFFKIIHFDISFYLFVGMVIYRIRIRRGCFKRQVPKGQIYGKPKSQGINQLKPKKRIQATAEV